MQIKMLNYEPMNEVHLNEVKLLEKLLKELDENKDVTNTLEEFIKDVKEHFAFEEGLMKKYDFFAYFPHKMEHDKIINELYNLRGKENEYLKKYFKEHFIPWLDNHILTIDTVTAGFFNMVGAK